MAWLNTAPQPAEGDKRTAKARRELLEEKGHIPELPECRPMILVETLFEIGPTVSGLAITHGELRSWQENTGIELEPWQARAIRRLSNDYIDQCRKSAALECDPPFVCAQSMRLKAIIKTQHIKDSIRAAAAL